MAHQLTITLSDELYDGLLSAAKGQTIDAYLAELARTAVAEAELAADYLAMSQDSEREREAAEWTEGLLLNVDDSDQ